MPSPNTYREAWKLFVGIGAQFDAAAASSVHRAMDKPAPVAVRPLPKANTDVKRSLPGVQRKQAQRSLDQYIQKKEEGAKAVWDAVAAYQKTHGFTSTHTTPAADKQDDETSMQAQHGSQCGSVKAKLA